MTDADPLLPEHTRALMARVADLEARLQAVHQVRAAMPEIRFGFKSDHDNFVRWLAELDNALAVKE